MKMNPCRFCGSNIGWILVSLTTFKSSHRCRTKFCRCKRSKKSTVKVRASQCFEWFGAFVLLRVREFVDPCGWLASKLVGRLAGYWPDMVPLVDVRNRHSRCDCDLL